MRPLELVDLTALMARSRGRSEIRIGLIDGPVDVQHPDLAGEHIRHVRGNRRAACVHADSTACRHATFVAGILSAKRTSLAPALCPGCTLLVCPIFAETTAGLDDMPRATPLALAAAIVDCIDDGARIINLSLGLAPSAAGERALEQALDYAIRQDVIVVAAAGNQGSVGSAAITLRPWLLPVVACDASGRPMNESNLGRSIGLRGLRAPGEGIVSLGFEGQSSTLRGTSVAVPFVTGTIALLWSEFPTASAAHIKLAVTRSLKRGRATIVPPLLNAEAAYQLLRASHATGRAA